MKPAPLFMKIGSDEMKHDMSRAKTAQKHKKNG